MNKNTNITSIYASTLNAKQKAQLFAIYRDYVYLSRNFEQITQINPSRYLASKQIEMIKDPNDDNMPWELGVANADEINNFKKFILTEDLDDNAQNLSFVSLTKTFPEEDELPPMQSTPSNYGVYAQVNALPHNIERYVAAYKKDIKLKDTTFIIDGKYSLKYTGTAFRNALINEAFDNENFTKNFSCILNISTQFKEDIRYIEKSKFEQANVEGLTLELMSPYENVLLSTLSNLAEETDNILKSLLLKRDPVNYLSKAESQSLIPSAHQLQDLLNVRHLLHHQFETLDGYGRFINGQDNQNKSIRTRYLDSYQRLCSGTFVERISRYVATADNFKNLVSGFTPNLLIREPSESNNKFIQRIKEYRKEHANTPIFIETSYSYKEKKKQALLNSINKLFDNVEIIDNIQSQNVDDFVKRILLYMERKKYIETFQILEHKMGEHHLFLGEKCPPAIGWNKLVKQQIITSKENEQWDKYKELRNELSHNYLSPELATQMLDLLPQMLKDAIELNDKIDSLKPTVVRTDKGTFLAKHSNGKIVEIDFEEKKIINIIEPNGKVKTERKTYSPIGKYTEEYPNNMSISLEGTKINSIKLPHGFIINFRKSRLVFPDDAKLFMEGKDKNYFVTPNSKIILDKEFNIISYIEDGKRINISQYEKIKTSNAHLITTNSTGKLKTDDINIAGDKTIVINFETKDNKTIISFSDNTIWEISDKENKLSHNGIVLSYKNRKSFVDSYNLGPHKFRKDNTR